MFKDEGFGRNFKKGSWDLRRDERRLHEVSISFPNRRKSGRRLTIDQDSQPLIAENLNWIDKSELND